MSLRSKFIPDSYYLIAPEITIIYLISRDTEVHQLLSQIAKAG
jgi:hypothetical protein